MSKEDKPKIPTMFHNMPPLPLAISSKHETLIADRFGEAFDALKVVHKEGLDKFLKNNLVTEDFLKKTYGGGGVGLDFLIDGFKGKSLHDLKVYVDDLANSLAPNKGLK